MGFFFFFIKGVLHNGYIFRPQGTHTTWHLILESPPLGWGGGGGGSVLPMLGEQGILGAKYSVMGAQGAPGGGALRYKMATHCQEAAPSGSGKHKNVGSTTLKTNEWAVNLKLRM